MPPRSHRRIFLHSNSHLLWMMAAVVVCGALAATPLNLIVNSTTGAFLLEDLSSPNAPPNIVESPQPSCPASIGTGGGAPQCQAFRFANAAAQEISLTNSASVFGFVISCLGVRTQRSPGADSNCSVSPVPTLRLVVNGSSSSAALVDDDVHLDRMVTGSLWSVRVAYNSTIPAFMSVSVEDTTAQCETDIVICKHVEAISTPSPLALPFVERVAPPYSNVWSASNASAPGDVEEVVGSGTVVSVQLRRLARSPAPPLTYPLVLVAANNTGVERFEALCAQSGSHVPVTANITRTSNSNIYWKLSFVVPQPAVFVTNASTLYVMCSRLPESAFTPIGSVMLFQPMRFSPVAYATVQWWAVHAGEPTSVAVFGSSELNATVDKMVAFAAAEGSHVTCASLGAAVDDGGNATHPLLEYLGVAIVHGNLSTAASGRVRWAAVFHDISVPYHMCYGVAALEQGALASRLWVDVLQSSRLNATLLAALGRSIATTPAPVPTPVPPTPLPVPTIPGGCPHASIAELANFTSGDGVFVAMFIRSLRLTSERLTDLARELSTVLCVDITARDLYPWCINCAANPTQANALVFTVATTPEYNGVERMAYFTYGFYPANANDWNTRFDVTGVVPLSRSTRFSVEEEATSLAQLVVGIAIAGVVCFAVCLCGVGFVCCRRYRVWGVESSARVLPAVVIQNGVTLATRADFRTSHLVVASTAAEHYGSDDDSDGPDPIEHDAVAGVIVTTSPAAAGPHQHSAELDEVYGLRSNASYLPRPTTSDASASTATAASQQQRREAPAFTTTVEHESSDTAATQRSAEEVEMTEV